jgi:hypothetical protein
LVVKRTAENNVESTKRFCVCYFAQRAAAVAAKGELNSHAVFVRCGGLFRSAGREFELVLGDQQADGVRAASDLTAGKAVAKGLWVILAAAGEDAKLRVGGPFLLTFIAGSPEYSYLMLPHRQLPCAILMDRRSLQS